MAMSNPLKKIKTNKGKSPDGKHANNVYYLIFAIGVIFILVALLNYEKWPLAAPFLKELGFAFVIAVIIIFTVEKFTRSRHEEAAHDLINDMNHSLFKAIFKRYIPETVFNEVEKCLIKANIFRTKYEVYYTLTSIDPAIDDDRDRINHVACESKTRYRLSNNTDGPVTHTVKSVFELPIDSAWHDDVKVLEAKIGNKVLTSEEITQHSDTSDNKQLIFSYKLDFKPREEIDIFIKASLIKRTTDMEVWSSMLPSDGIKLTVSTPDRNIKVCASANHHEKITEVTNDDATRVWELDHGIFPYQSIVFWWSKQQD